MMVETDPAYPSLNLSMAVQLVAYELRMAWLEGARPRNRPGIDPGPVRKRSNTSWST